MHQADKIRNVALVGHRGSGKTSLNEALLYEAGVIQRARLLCDILADLYKTFAEQVVRHFREVHHTTESFIQSHHWHESLLKSIVDQDPKNAWYWAAKIVGVN